MDTALTVVILLLTLLLILIVLLYFFTQQGFRDVVSRLGTTGAPPTPAAAPARSPPWAVEVSSVKVPGPGSARKSRMAAQKAP